MNNHYFIGVLSGTSIDAIDVALVTFKDDYPTLIDTLLHPIPAEMSKECLRITQSNLTSVDELCLLDAKMGVLFAEAVNLLLKKIPVAPHSILAIGSHGQTLRHRPRLSPPFTLQIGDPNIISEETGITTVADFRRRDIAAKGQGAPLAPAFHASVFRDPNEDRVILNIGGISNITILPADLEQPILGFDTGPGNCLSDLWMEKHFNKPFDKSGEVAASGNIHELLLQLCLADDYFTLPPPKSIGREYFHLAWLNTYLQKAQANECTTEDLQATILAITTHSISQHILRYASRNAQVFVCGGGAHNTFLIKELERQLERSVTSTQILGIPPDWVEAMLFAWLAKQTLEGKPGNCPSVTGATHEVVLGAIYGARVQS